MTRTGRLCVDSWAGRSETVVEVLEETRDRYRIRAIEATRLAGRWRTLQPGETVLVPKYAITNIEVDDDT